MYSLRTKDWKTELSELDELFGREPRYPLTAIEDYISYEIENQNQVIRESSAEISNGIVDSTNAICGTLENGFNNLISANQAGFDEVNNNLSDISSILTWGFNAVLEQQRVTNLLLGNVLLLLKIPDIQKERQYYIEQGLKFFQNSRVDKSFYEDALENLLKAENIEKTDYFTLQRIGIIYLFSKKHLDVNKALEYFHKSSKYSIGETHSSSVQTTNYLESDLSQDLSSQVRSILDIKKYTAKSYFYTSVCYYLNKDFKTALDYAKKSFELDNSFLDAQFNMIKYACCIGNLESFAIKNLSELIKKERLFSVKAISDPDIVDKPYIQNYLTKLTEEKHLEAKQGYNKLKSYKVDNSKVKNILNEIENNINNKTFLNSMKVIDTLNASNEWNFNFIYFKSENQEKYFNDANHKIENLKNNRDFNKKISSTQKLNKDEIINYSKNLIHFPELAKENKSSTLEEFLKMEEYYQKHVPSFHNAESKLNHFIENKIGNTEKKRESNSLATVIIAFPFALVIGFIFAIIGGACFGFLVGIIGAFFGAFGMTFYVVTAIATTIFTCIFTYNSLKEIYEEKSNKNVFVQVFGNIRKMIKDVYETYANA